MMKTRLSTDAIRWMRDERGISLKTLTLMRCESAMDRFGDEQEASIRFPYFKNRKKVNHKSRALHEKRFVSQLGGEQTWYNLDHVIDGVTSGSFEQVFVVEGEIDVLSLVECGVTYCVSPPNGAGGSPSQDHANLEKHFPYINESLRLGLNKVKHWVLAVDKDVAGEALRNQLVKKLGVGLCSYVMA